jgi:branched-chain amino acid transport system permease protein
LASESKQGKSELDILLSEPVQALVAINVLLTLSLLFPFAAGVWSLGLPGFMAVGAYLSAWLTMNMGWGIGPAIAMGGLAGAASAIPFALLTLRIRDIYLAIATLAAAELIVLFFSHFKPTGAVMGMTGMPYLETHWLLILVAGCLAASSWLYNSRFGKALVAAGSDPMVAACHGLNVPTFQFASLAIGGLLAGMAGACFAHYYSFISPGNFGFHRTTDILLFLVVGGLTPLGAVAGAMILTLVPQVITSLEKWAPAMYGCVVLLMAVFRPAGLLPKNQLVKLFITKTNRKSSAAERARSKDA